MYRVERMHGKLHQDIALLTIRTQSRFKGSVDKRVSSILDSE